MNRHEVRRRSVSIVGGVLLSALLFGAASCSEDPGPPARPASNVELPAARAQVRSLFVAIEERDCTRIIGRLALAEDEEHCQEFLHDAAEHRIRLVEIIEAHADGRDVDAAIVRAAVERDGETQQVMIRVTHQDERWTIAF